VRSARRDERGPPKAMAGAPLFATEIGRTPFQVARKMATLQLSSQRVGNLSEMAPQLPGQGPTPAFWNKNHILFTLPLGVTETFGFVHRDSPLRRVLGGSRPECPRWTPGNVKLFLSPRQSRGISLLFKSEFTFFEVQMKRMSGNALEFCRPPLYDRNDSMPLI